MFFEASEQRGEIILFSMVCFFFKFNSAISFLLNVYPKWYCYKLFAQLAQIVTPINNSSSVPSVIQIVDASSHSSYAIPLLSLMHHLKASLFSGLCHFRF